MAAMLSRSTRLLSLTAATAFLLASGAREAQADKNDKYVFEIAKIQLKVPSADKALAELVRVQLQKAIAKHPSLVILPENAPDPKKDPEKFKKYLKKAKLKAYKVNVEITGFTHEVLELEGRKGKRLKVSIALRTFGETIPGRVMAFAGEGGSTIMLDVGKRVRPRDTEFAIKDSADLALGQALDVSIKKLQAPKHKKKRRKNRRKK